MKTILNPEARQEIFSRLNKLTSESHRRWGKMTAHQMVCHLADSTRIALGGLHVQFIGNVATRTRLFRMMAFNPLPWPRGVLKTAPEIDQALDGTRPTAFEADRRELVQLMEEFIRNNARTDWPEHPVMGRFSREDWGRQIYRHSDHHLKQFGV